MATLASIPEAPSRRSAISLTGHSAPRVTAFQRSRPRSRVVVLSERPSRFFHRNRHTVASTSCHDYAEDATQTDKDAGKSMTTGLSASSSERCFPKLHLPDDLVSPLYSPASSVKEPSELSVDLDSFPVPPNRSKGWPLPDGDVKPTSFGQPKVDDGVSPPDSKLPPKWKPAQPSSDSQMVLPRPKHRPGHRHSRKCSTQEESHIEDPMDPGAAEAITQSIAELFQRFSFSDKKPSRAPSTKPFIQSRFSGTRKSRQSSRKSSVQSRTASQRKELSRFSKELQEYAEKVGAKGKIPVFTPTPCATPATFRTVSALMPYRSEFRAAGLAVTSQDQAQAKFGAGQKVKKPVGKRRKPLSSKPIESHVSQLDGKQETSTNPSAVIEFANDKTAESWRHVLIDRAPIIPPRKHSLIPGNAKSTSSHCFPCFSRKPNPSISVEPRVHQKLRKSRAPETRQEEVPEATDQPNSPERPDRRRTPNPWGHQSSSDDRGPWRVPDDISGRERMNSAATAPVKLSRRPVGLRRRSMVYGQVQVRRGPRATGKRRVRTENSASRKRPGAARPSVGEAPLDLIPQVSSKMNLHRFAGRQYQSLPMPLDVVRQRQGSQGGMGPPSVSNYQRPRRGTTNGLPTSRELPGVPLLKVKLPPNKAALAAQEIARHDLGPYPISIPKPRRRSHLTDSPAGVPRRLTSFGKPHRPSRGNKAADEIEDRDVLRGLRIAASAACDEAMDRLVHEKRGVHIRNFLAGLVSLDTVSSSQRSPTDEERTRKRRSQIRMLKQQMRRSQEARRRSGMLT